MPGQAVAQTLKYAEVVDVDMDATNDVNFADVEDYGHRVVVNINKAALDGYLGWQRPIGQARPAAMLVDSTGFMTSLKTALNSSYIDVDGVTGGLHFGTDNMNLNADARLRATGVSANDIPLAFILYKLYGSSSVATLDNIYNLADAHGMLSSETVSEAVSASFDDAVAGAVDTMFRDLLAADPHRFFDASGVPVTGIFESKVDVPGVGTWKLTDNDILELKLKMVFHSKITRRGVAGREHLLTSTDAPATQENQQTVISPDDYFYIRLQLKVDSAAPSGIPPPPPTYPPVDWMLRWVDGNTANSGQVVTTGSSIAFGGSKPLAYSTTRGYSTNFLFKFKVASGGFNSVGLSSNPEVNSPYSPWIGNDFSFFVNNGYLMIRERSTDYAVAGDYNASTEFKITYDGVNVKYYVNGVLVRTKPRVADSTVFYPNMFFNTPLTEITEFAWESLA